MTLTPAQEQAQRFALWTSALTSGRFKKAVGTLGLVQPATQSAFARFFKQVTTSPPHPALAPTTPPTSIPNVSFCALGVGWEVAAENGYPVYRQYIRKTSPSGWAILYSDIPDSNLYQAASFSTDLLRWYGLPTEEDDFDFTKHPYVKDSSREKLGRQTVAWANDAKNWSLREIGQALQEYYGQYYNSRILEEERASIQLDPNPRPLPNLTLVH